MHEHLIRSPRGKLRWVVEDRGFTTPCWIWQMSTNPDGYGLWQRHGRQTTAHRLVYEEFRGPIPTGLQIDHLCRVHPCVNPDHLEPVTCKENLRRGIRGRKITAADVRVIKRALLDGQSGASLARAYAVSEAMISDIKHGHAWADVEPETLAVLASA